MTVASYSGKSFKGGGIDVYVCVTVSVYFCLCLSLCI